MALGSEMIIISKVLPGPAMVQVKKKKARILISCKLQASSLTMNKG
jgi:hypothetical protein